jgi:hypothetical protein
MNTHYFIQFNDKTVIWTMFTMSSPDVKTRLTPKGVARLMVLFPNTNKLIFNCSEDSLNNVVHHSTAFFLKALLDIKNEMKKEDMTADSELLLH